MKILLSNDDGYQAEGIQFLFKALQKYGEVLLVAPHNHMSGASVSRIFWDKTQVYKHSEHVYSVNGTPADAVSLALHGLNYRPDVVISGVNSGYNLGADTVYSGTVGACMEALKVGLPGIAFSADYNELKQAKKDLDTVMTFILENKLLSTKYMLNVNFSSAKAKATKGIMITDLGFRAVRHYYVQEGENYVTKRDFTDEQFIEGTDLHAVHNGYISITPLKFGNQTDFGLKELHLKTRSKQS